MGVSGEKSTGTVTRYLSEGGAGVLYNGVRRATGTKRAEFEGLEDSDSSLTVPSVPRDCRIPDCQAAVNGG